MQRPEQRGLALLAPPAQLSWEEAGPPPCCSQRKGVSVAGERPDQ